MALLPTEDALTNSSTTNAAQKTNFANLRNFIADLLGTDSSDKAAARAALGTVGAGDAVSTLTMATNRLLGRTTASTGAVEEIQMGAGLTLAAGVLSASSSSVLRASQATTSGSFNDFTALPAGVKRVTINISGFSTNGLSGPMIQIGDSGGVETTGYSGVVIQHLTASAPTLLGFTTGFTFEIGMAAATVLSGNIVLTLEDATSNKWNAVGSFWRVGSSAVQISLVGEKSLSAALDRIRITMANGTDLLDAGSWSVAYE